MKQAKGKAKAEVASMKAKTSYLDVNQLTKLLVAELKNIELELLAKFLNLPSQVSSVQEKLKTMDSLPSLLHKVTDTMNRFDGNKESKKMQKTILKQNYENFTASSQEGLHKTYDRFHKLISQLEIHCEVISQEDANLKLLRSLPSAYNNIALIMRNKSDLDTLSMDDLYNNLKGNRNRDASRRNATEDTFTTNALVVQDGIGSSSLDSETISAKDKTGLGYDGKMNESDLNDIHVNESEVLDNVFDSVIESRESDGDDNQVNDRFKKGEGYHAVPL
nr:hypothetical protein [Tanacetum cinerariifolium]